VGRQENGVKTATIHSLGRYQQVYKTTRMNNLNEKIKSYSNATLLKIIHDSDNYQHLVIELAKKEIALRQLTDRELNEVIFKLEIERKEIKSKRYIKFVTIILGCLTILFLCKVLKTLLVSKDSGELAFLLVFDLIPLFVVPIAAILFWKRKKIGWILLVLFLIFSTFSSISGLIMTANVLFLGGPVIGDTSPQILGVMNFSLFLFYIGILLGLFKESIRGIFNISQRTIFTTVGLMLTLIGAFVFLFVIMVLRHFV
jgi:hypothetical protein